MTKKQFEKERLYELTMACFRTLMIRGLITADEYNIIDTKMRAKYSQLLGGLYPQNTLIYKEYNGNICNTEELSEGD